MARHHRSTTSAQADLARTRGERPGGDEDRLGTSTQSEWEQEKRREGAGPGWMRCLQVRAQIAERRSNRVSAAHSPHALSQPTNSFHSLLSLLLLFLLPLHTHSIPALIMTSGSTKTASNERTALLGHARTKSEEPQQPPKLRRELNGRQVSMIAIVERLCI